MWARVRRSRKGWSSDPVGLITGWGISITLCPWRGGRNGSVNLGSLGWTGAEPSGDVASQAGSRWGSRGNSARCFPPASTLRFPCCPHQVNSAKGQKSCRDSDLPMSHLGVTVIIFCLSRQCVGLSRKGTCTCSLDSAWAC